MCKLNLNNPIFKITLLEDTSEVFYGWGNREENQLNPDDSLDPRNPDLRDCPPPTAAHF